MAQHTTFIAPMSKDSFKTIISAALLAQLADGKTLEQAFSIVFGESVYRDLVSQLYDDLRSGAR